MPDAWREVGELRITLERTNNRNVRISRPGAVGFWLTQKVGGRGRRLALWRPELE